MADPVSWFAIEPGWKVVDGEGGDVGRVETVVGEESRDIFTGLAIATSLTGKPKYVPAERVASIVDGEVRLDLDGEEAHDLPDYVD